MPTTRTDIRNGISSLAIALIAVIALFNIATEQSPHLNSPLILGATAVLVILTGWQILRQPQALQWDIFIVVLLLGALLPSVRGGIYIVNSAVLTTVILSLMGLTTRDAIPQLLVMGLLYLTAIVGALVILSTTALGIQLGATQRYLLHLLCLLGAVVALYVPTDDPQPARVIIYPYLLISLAIFFSFNWGIILLYSGVLGAALTRHTDDLFSLRATVLIYIPMLILVLFVPFITLLARNTSILSGDLVDAIPLREHAGRVLTAYITQIDDPADILNARITDVELDGRRLAVLTVDAQPFSESQVIYPLALSDGTGYWLDFSVARLDERVTQALFFQIDIERDSGERVTVFRYRHDADRLRRWTDVTVDLSAFAGERVTLRLIANTEGTEAAQAAWGRVRIAQAPQAALMSVREQALTTASDRLERDVQPRLQAPLSALALRWQYNRVVLDNANAGALRGNGELRTDSIALNDGVLWGLRHGVPGVMIYVVLFFSSLVQVAFRRYPAVNGWLVLMLVLYGLWGGVTALPVGYLLLSIFATQIEN
jgi:hypothetical protein